MSLRIFPATELHLLPNTAVDLRFAAHINRVWTELTTVAGVSASLAPQPAFVQFAGTRLTASATGQAVTRFTVQSGGSVAATAPMRIAVHQQLRRLFVALPTITLQTNRSDRIVTVYGEFAETDGTLVTADITSHPYLRYAPTVSGPATVHVDAVGRITTGPGAGDVDVTISVVSTLNQPAPSVTLRVHVVDAITDRPILDRFHEGTAVRKKSILFLADGYVAAQQKEFETLARDIGTRLLRTISPYRHLRESFDLYTAFLPSTEDGCTVGPPLFFKPGLTDVAFSVPTDQPIARGAVTLELILHNLGHPATSPAQSLAAARQQLSTLVGAPITATQFPQDLFTLWQSLRTPPPTSRLRETFFGLMVGERANGTETVDEPVPTPPVPGWPPIDAAIFKPRLAVRTPVFDERRLPDLLSNDPKTAHLAAFSAFVRTLRRQNGFQGEGAMWAQPRQASTDGGSFGLVVILMRADHYSGVRAEGCVMLSVGSGMQHHVSVSHVPRLLEVVPVARPISAAHQRLGFAPMPLDVLLDVVAHELAHADALGRMSDEYDDPGRGRVNVGSPNDVTFVEGTPNAQLIANAQRPGGQVLDPTRIKWNWERAEGAARIETIRVDGAANIAIEVAADQAVALPTIAPGRLLTLRHARLDLPHPQSPIVGMLTAPPLPQTLTLVSFDRNAQRLICSVQGATAPATVVDTFPPGSVLIVPRLVAGATMTLILPAVAADLVANGRFSPSSAQCVPANPVARAIPGFRYPANQLRAIAAYEVGAGFACGAMRPTGECKMRTLSGPGQPPVDFCHVCKYAMANAVDPAALPVIDTEYP